MNVFESKKSKNLGYLLQFLPDCLVDQSNNPKIKFDGHNLKSAYLIDLVHNLLLKYYFKKNNEFNLSSVILKEKYGCLYNYYIQYLKENNILVLVKNHLKGRNARVYKFNEDIFKKPIHKYHNIDTILLKKYSKSKNIINKIDSESDLINPIIKSKIIKDLFDVEIDYSKSIFYLDSSSCDIDVYQKNKYSVESIKDKHIFYHFDNYGRFHTNFTILKSYIRKNCLLIDGEETCEIDIKNSQPLFLNKLLNQNIEKIDADELKLFRNLTFYGGFYDYLQSKFNIQDKKTVKEITYKVLFGKNYSNKFDKKFSQIFPTIHSFIKEFKKMKGDYRVLSYELQNLESNFLFNKVIKHIIKTDPEIKIITCHDSLICKESDYETVFQIFKTHLDSEFIDCISN